MTNAELLEFIQQPGFNIQDYEPVETDTLAQQEEKIAFLRQVASLADDQELTLPEPITCMVNCVINFLLCVDGGTGGGWVYAVCHSALENCLANCQS